jgi:hypothetical protein
MVSKWMSTLLQYNRQKETASTAVWTDEHHTILCSLDAFESTTVDFPFQNGILIPATCRYWRAVR